MLKVLTIPDLHYGSHNKKYLKILLEFGTDWKPDVLIWSGDNMDFDSISFHDRAKPKLLENKRLMKEYEVFNELLDYTEKLFKPDKTIYMYGNHEDRVRRLIEGDPQYEGFIEVDRCLRLEARGYKVYPMNESYTLGPLTWFHGFYTNKYHSAKTVEVFHKNVIYGHSHTVQEFTHPTPDKKSAVMGKCIGTGQKVPAWWLNRPSWQVNAFHIAYIYKGGFNDYTVKVDKGKCMVNDKLYTA